MIIESLADLLVTAGLGALGTDIFVHMMPVDCARGIMLRAPFGGIPFHHDLPGYFKGKVTLITRSTNYLDAQTMMNNAVTALTKKNAQVGSFHVNYCRPFAQPVPFPLSAGGEVEFNTFMDICFVE